MKSFKKFIKEGKTLHSHLSDMDVELAGIERGLGKIGTLVTREFRTKILKMLKSIRQEFNKEISLQEK